MRMVFSLECMIAADLATAGEVAPIVTAPPGAVNGPPPGWRDPAGACRIEPPGRFEAAPAVGAITA